MPRNDFIAEVMQILDSDPDGKEIQVNRVKFLRYSEVRDEYDDVVRSLNESDPN